MFIGELVSLAVATKATNKRVGRVKIERLAVNGGLSKSLGSFQLFYVKHGIHYKAECPFRGGKGSSQGVYEGHGYVRFSLRIQPIDATH